MRNLSKDMTDGEKGRFARFIVPFFVGKHKQKDVRLWDGLASRLGPELLAQKAIQVESVKKVLSLLGRFGRYLAIRGVIDRPWAILLPTRGRSLATPLQMTDLPSIFKSYLFLRVAKESSGANFLGMLGLVDLDD